MGLEEQKEEREVLDSIFPDEITDISETSYRISITLDVQDFSNDAPEAPTILLHITYPETYPEVPPTLDVTQPPNTPKHPLLDVSSDKPHLLETLEPIIQESLGMAMVFTLVTTLKDSAESLIADRQKQLEEEREVAARKVEEEENRRFHGVAVTKERFWAWREGFRKEMEEKERLRREEEEMLEGKGRKGGKVEEKKLTGRQLWERGMVGRVDEEDGDLDGEEELDVAKLKVSG